MMSLYYTEAATHHSTGLLGNGHTDSVALLVASGADINMKNNVS